MPEEEAEDDDTCPVCGDTYDHKRTEGSPAGRTASLRSDAVQCKTAGNSREPREVYVHLDGTPRARTRTPVTGAINTGTGPDLFERPDPADIDIGTPGISRPVEEDDRDLSDGDADA